MDSNRKILEVKNLSTYFHTARGTVHAVEDVSFSLYQGESLGLVGESGSGKSVTSLSILNLVRPPGRIESGEILYNGRNVLEFDDRELRDYRGKEIAMVFQEPLSSLNPAFTIGWQLEEAFRLHSSWNREEIREKTIEMLEQVRIPEAEKRLGDYPHAFSGGMRQRVLIAIALACRPKILIADEPTTALDVTVQADIMDLLDELKGRMDLSVLLISHNLNLVGQRCGRIAVMYAGMILEMASTDELFCRPMHPYTQGLLKALPNRLGPGERLAAIPGEVPVNTQKAESCIFMDRCGRACPECGKRLPQLKDVGEGHWCRCIRAGR